MKNFKDILVALGNVKWTHVLILLAIVAILLIGAAGLSYIYAQKGAKDAVNAELALQEQIHDYEMNLRMENSGRLNNVVLQLMYETNADRVLLAEYL